MGQTTSKAPVSPAPCSTDDAALETLRNRTKQISVSVSQRTPWGPRFSVGAGFHGDFSRLAETCVEYVEPPQILPRASDTKSEFKVVSSASEVSELLNAGGSASVAGWGVNASVSYKLSREVKVQKNSVCAVLVKSFTTSEVIVADPSIAARRVKLYAPAKETLRNGGPQKFHAKYGTHYIKGFVKGGTFIGIYEMQFSSHEDKTQQAASVDAAFRGWGLKAKASAEVSRQISSISGLMQASGRYVATGWSEAEGKGYLPKDVNSLETLVKAAETMSTTHSAEVEAVLGKYEDIEDYQQARQAWEARVRSRVTPQICISDVHYTKISALLSQEFMHYEKLEEQLEGETQQELAALHRECRNAKDCICFWVGGIGGQDDEATLHARVRKSLAQLEAVLLTYSSGPAPPKDAHPDKVQLFDKGKVLAAKLFRADQIEAKLLAHRRAALPAANMAGLPAASTLGRASTEPWQLTNFPAQDAQFIWSVDTAAVGSAPTDELVVLSRTLTLPPHAKALQLVLMADDHVSAFVNGIYVGSTGWPYWHGYGACEGQRQQRCWMDIQAARLAPATTVTVKLRGSNNSGSAGVVGAVYAVYEDGRKERLCVTDNSWSLEMERSVRVPDTNCLDTLGSAFVLNTLFDRTLADYGFPDNAARPIWSEPGVDVKDAADDVISEFHCRVPRRSAAVTAELVVMVNDGAEVFVNGVFKGVTMGWRPSTFAIGTLLVGENVISLRCTNWSGNYAGNKMAGVAAALKVLTKEGASFVLRTGEDDGNGRDRSWRFKTTRRW